MPMAKWQIASLPSSRGGAGFGQRVKDGWMATVIVGGALANKPLNGGEAWVRLTWALGLRRLGFDVWFAELIAPEHCTDEAGRPVDFEASVNRSFFEQVTREFGLAGSACLVCSDGRTAGVEYGELLDRADGAELLVNVSGHITDPEVLRRPKRRLYIDLDPGFTQFWDEDATSGFQLGGHEHYITVGTNIGTSGCPIPTGGLAWRAVLPPVLLDEWPARPPPDPTGRFTTVATWRSPYGPVEHDGRRYGLKHHEFRKFIELPARAAGAEFEVALGIYPGDAEDLARLQASGWTVREPRATVPDPVAFRRYVQDSAAEFSVAQGVYVETKSGWFSDRTACYLASGRPALVQDTGFSRSLRAEDGLLTFRTLDDAADGVERIASDYEDHCRSARAIAEEHFDSDRILGDLLDDLGVSVDSVPARDAPASESATARWNV
jgi:hypothetical protein